MNKRHLQNCLSKEKRKFEANVKKYKSWIESGCDKSIKLKSVPLVSGNLISKPVASTSAEANSYSPRNIEVKENCHYIQPWPVKLTENILDEHFAENTQEVNANESIIPRVTYSSSLTKNEDILTVLQSIVQGQKELNTRLEKLEQNQAIILENQSILSNGQATMVSNQQLIADQLAASVVSKSEIMAQSKVLMECKVAIKRIEEFVCHMTGEKYDINTDEVASMLPLQTLEAVGEIEQRLDSPDFAQAMTTYLHKVKGISEDVGTIIRAIFTDDLLEKYNWEGRWEKQSLEKLMLFNKTLRDVFQQQGSFNFERSVRKAVELSHHRVKQKKYLKREK